MASAPKLDMSDAKMRAAMKVTGITEADLEIKPPPKEKGAETSPGQTERLQQRAEYMERKRDQLIE